MASQEKEAASDPQTNGPGKNEAERRRFLRLLRVVSAVMIVLPIARWASDYSSAEIISLSLHDANQVQALPDGTAQVLKAIGDEGRLAIFAHAPSRLEWRAQPRKGPCLLRVETGLEEKAWAEHESDGVLFRVSIVREANEEPLHEFVLNPSQNESHRHWQPIEVPFHSDGTPLNLALETTNRAEMSQQFDWAYWAEPSVEEIARWPSPLWIGLGICILILCYRLQPRGKSADGPRKVGAIEGCVHVGLSLLAAFAICEIILQLHPLLLPIEANKYLPDNGLLYFPKETQQEEFDRRYGYKYRPHQRWNWARKYDLVLMRRVSKKYADPDPIRIRVETDEDGFRNPQNAGPYPVLALGDSLTAAINVQANETWPSTVSQMLGVTVRNLGVTGYSPQQNLVALREFGLPNSPRVVLFSLFEGNDILDARRFESFKTWRMSWPESVSKLRRVSAGNMIHQRKDLLLTRALYRFTRDTLSAWFADIPDPVPPEGEFVFNPVGGEIAGRGVQSAFFNAYLYHATFSRERWAKHPGWKPTCDALLEAKRVCTEADIQMLTVLMPSKGSVYLPLLSGAYDPNEFDRYVQQAAEDDSPGNRTWHEKFIANNRALTELVMEFCTENGIDCIDLRPALQDAAERGEEVYFPFDTHWNPYGHAIAGETVAAEIKKLGYLDQSAQ